MAGGDVQHLEVVVVQLHLRPFHHAETHGDERAADLPHDLGGGMEPSGDHRAARQGNVQSIAGRQRGLGDLAGATGQGFLQRVLGLVGPRADGPAFIRFQGGDGAEQRCELSPPAQVGYAPLFGIFGIGNGFQFAERVAGDLVD